MKRILLAFLLIPFMGCKVDKDDSLETVIVHATSTLANDNAKSGTCLVYPLKVNNIETKYDILVCVR